jgi:hypothetical protein
MSSSDSLNVAEKRKIHVQFRHSLNVAEKRKIHVQFRQSERG